MRGPIRLLQPAVIFALGLAIASAAHPATPSSGTIGPAAPSASWQGQSYTLAATAGTAATSDACPPATLDSMNTVCDHYRLTVAVDPTYWNTRSGEAVIRITWASSSNDFDLFVFDSQGNLVDDSAQGNTTFEQITIFKPSGVYDVVVVPFTVVNSGYSGSASFSSDSSRPTPKWDTVTHGACCEGNLAASGSATYVLLPELVTGNDIKRSLDGGKTWKKIYPPADVSVPFGIEGDLRAFENDVVFFGTELAAGVAAHSDDQGDSWTIVQIPVAFVANDQAWLYMGPLSNVCPIQTEPYVLTGWYRIGSVALFSCDGGLTWPIQTPLVGNDGDGPVHVVCEQTAHAPASAGDTRIANRNFANMKSGRHGGWGTDERFYWSEVANGSLYVCKTNNFGVTWDGVRHPLAAGTPDGQVVTTLAFDDKGTLYVLHANKLYVSFDQGESFRYVHTLPRWGSDPTVGDDGSAEFFVVSGGTIYVGLKEPGANGTGKIWYLRGRDVDTARPSWKEELVDTVGSVRLDFMQITIDGNGIPTIGYTTPPDFTNGTTTSSRSVAP